MFVYFGFTKILWLETNLPVASSSSAIPSSLSGLEALKNTISYDNYTMLPVCRFQNKKEMENGALQESFMVLLYGFTSIVHMFYVWMLNIPPSLLFTEKKTR